MDILNLKVGQNKRKLKIVNVKKERVIIHERDAEKIVFEALDECTNNMFNISDAWFKTEDGKFTIKGLWLALQNDGSEISKNSSLAKIMQFYNKDTLGEFVGEQITAYPDDNNFLVLVACNLPESV